MCASAQEELFSAGSKRQLSHEFCPVDLAEPRHLTAIDVTGTSP